MKAIDQPSAMKVLSDLFSEYEGEHIEILLNAINNIHEVVETNILKSTKQQNRRRSLEQRVNAIAEQFTDSGTIRYYYAPGSNHFVSCDGAHYTIVREDDVIAAVLRALQTDPVLCKAKQKSRHIIMKRIKTNLLTDCIPDSDTIKNVVDLLRSVLLPTKNDAKYLLTIIGDIILRKTGDLIFLVPPHVLKHIEMLSDLIASDIGHRDTIVKHFADSYISNNAEKCRVVRTKTELPGTLTSLKGQTYNICAVACHYSNQYQSADDYVRSCSASDPSLVQSAFSPKTFTLEHAISGFIKDCTVPSSNNNAANTPDSHVKAAWTIWQRKSSFFLDCSWSAVKSLLPHKDETSCALVLREGQYISMCFNFCRSSLEYDATETLLELTELFALFVESADLQHNEEMFQEVAIASSIAMGATVDGHFIHGLRSLSWDKHTEVVSFLEGTHSSSPPNVLATYREYARATTGRKVSRAYFTHKLSESAAF